MLERGRGRCSGPYCWAFSFRIASSRVIDDETTAERKLSCAGGYEQPHSVVHEMGGVTEW